MTLNFRLKLFGYVYYCFFFVSFNSRWQKKKMNGKKALQNSTLKKNTLVLFCHVEISINWVFVFICLFVSVVCLLQLKPGPNSTQRKEEANKKMENKFKWISTSVSCCTIFDWFWTRFSCCFFLLRSFSRSVYSFVSLFRQMFTLVSRWFDLQSIFKSMFWFSALHLSLSLSLCVFLIRMQYSNFHETAIASHSMQFRKTEQYFHCAIVVCKCAFFFSDSLAFIAMRWICIDDLSAYVAKERNELVECSEFSTLQSVLACANVPMIWD